MRNLFITSIILSTFFSCKNSKQTTQASASATTNTTISQPEVETELPDSMYRVIVSFISIGEGIDSKAAEQLEELIINHQRDFGMPLAKEEYRWGREGEIDFCFNMKNEQRKAKDTFVRQVREKFSENKLVQIEENTVCRHKR